MLMDFVKGVCIALVVIAIWLLITPWLSGAIDWVEDMYREYQLWVSEVLR